MKFTDMRNTRRWLSGALLALPFLVAQVAVTQLASDAGFKAPGAAMAQEEKKEQRETRRTPALRNKVYEQLAEAQTFIEAKRAGVIRHIGFSGHRSAPAFSCFFPCPGFARWLFEKQRHPSGDGGLSPGSRGGQASDA